MDKKRKEEEGKQQEEHGNECPLRKMMNNESTETKEFTEIAIG